MSYENINSKPGEGGKNAPDVSRWVSQALNSPIEHLTIENLYLPTGNLNKSNSLFIYSSYSIINTVNNLKISRIMKIKVLHLFSRIYQKQKFSNYGAHKKHGARLNSEILKRDYGFRDLYEIRNLLLTMGAIKVRPEYSRDHALSKRYQINEALNLGPIIPCRVKAEGKLWARLSGASHWFQNGAADAEPNNCPKWIKEADHPEYARRRNYLLATQERLVLKDDWKTLLPSIEEDRHDGFTQSGEAFNEGAFYAKVGESGRWFHYLTGCYREIRPKILIDGEPTTEIDIKAAQPTIIATFYPENSPEREKYLEMVLSGKFYERVAALVGIEFRPDSEDRVEFKKKCLKQVFYDAADDNIRPSYKVRQAFNAEYPEMGEILAMKRRAAGDKLAMQMQKLEAQIVIDGVIPKAIDADIPVLPVHDSIFCRTKDYPQVHKWLMDAFFDATGIQPIVKINHHQ